jgi:hypothetical protein
VPVHRIGPEVEDRAPTGVGAPLGVTRVGTRVRTVVGVGQVWAAMEALAVTVALAVMAAVTEAAVVTEAAEVSAVEAAAAGDKNHETDIKLKTRVGRRLCDL